LKKTDDILTPEGAKTRGNNLVTPLKIPRCEYYQYKDTFNASLCIILAKPILNELKSRKLSINKFIEQLNNDGFKYYYSGFTSAVRGKNPFIQNFTYFSKLYNYLNLPFPSLEYLNSFD
jgi:hypothetical protein